MSAYVIDTHALFWHFTRSPKLSASARAVLREAERGEHELLIPAIVLAELFYLNSKVGRPLSFSTEVERLRQTRQVTLVPFLPEHVADFERDFAVTEMHDRIIVGVARRAGAACLTADASISRSGLVEVVW